MEDIKINMEGADLALVKVATEIDINKFIPICIPRKGLTSYSSDCDSILANLHKFRRQAYTE